MMFAHGTPYIWICWHDVQAMWPLITALSFAGLVYGRRIFDVVHRLFTK